jgi:Tol biopolymer transport system component
VLVAVLAYVPFADAAFPGRNGEVSFSRTAQSSDIYSVDPFGTAEVNITNQSYSRFPAWSPDGSRIAFSQNLSIFTANPDGSGKALVLNWGGSVWDLDWSPGGTKLVAELWTCIDDPLECHQDIYTMNLDGSDLTNITSGDGFDDRRPAWSADGTKIAFDSVRNGVSGIYTMNPDGSGVTALTQNPTSFDTSPDWSPDSTRLLFTRGRPNYGPEDGGDLYTMNAAGGDLTTWGYGGIGPSWSPDGTRIAMGQGAGGVVTVSAEGGDFHRLTDPPGALRDLDTDWRPLAPVSPPPPTGSGYPRPKGATPMLVYLVPAYRGCTSPNRTHGPPLVFGSCNPPTQVTSGPTIGTADSNGQPTKAVGSVRLTTMVGQPGPPDDTDLKIEVLQTDVRNSEVLDDYAHNEGELDLRLPLRITDKWSGGGSDASATVSDFLLRFVVPCSYTPDTTIGSTCEVATTVDAVYPGAITESKRSIWELGQIQLFDGGSDVKAETGPDNRLFEVQGVFVP